MIDGPNFYATAETATKGVVVGNNYPVISHFQIGQVCSAIGEWVPWLFPAFATASLDLLSDSQTVAARLAQARATARAFWYFLTGPRRTRRPWWPIWPILAAAQTLKMAGRRVECAFWRDKSCMHVTCVPMPQPTLSDASPPYLFSCFLSLLRGPLPIFDVMMFI